MSLALKMNKQDLIQRAEILQKIRDFFSARQVIAVDTPLLSPYTIPDPNIHSFDLMYQQKKYFLQTSPEFHMKRLIAKHKMSLYQITKSFRQDESGQNHNPEFSILEWYRVGYDLHQLMDEVNELLTLILPFKQSERLSYQALFLKYAEIDPFKLSEVELTRFVKNKLKDEVADLVLSSKDDWLNILLTHCIEPQLKNREIMFVYDYPSTQAALAKIEQGVAKRFEVYVRGIELANGFHELNNSSLQRQRFVEDNNARAKNHLPLIPLDENFLQTLDDLPDCAGVALGIDRLIMLALNLNHISNVLAFDWNAC